MRDISSSNRNDRADVTRATLLDAARRLFGRDGYAATSVHAIVEAADVTKGAFYHHFDGKQAIFLQVFEEVQREIGRRAFVVHLDSERIGADGSTRSRVRDLSAETNDQVWAHLLQGCQTYLQLHTDPAVQRIVLIDGPAVLPWTQQNRVRSEHGTVLLRAGLRRAIARRIVRPLPLQLLATMLAGSLNEACIAIANAVDRDAALEEAIEVVECFLAGLRQD